MAGSHCRYTGNYTWCTGEEKSGTKRDCDSRICLLGHWNNFMCSDVCCVYCMRRWTGCFSIKIKNFKMEEL